MKTSFEFEKVISRGKSQLKKYDEDVSNILKITDYCGTLTYNSADLINSIDAEIIRMVEMKERFTSQVDEYCNALIEKRNKISSITDNTKEGE